MIEELGHAYLRSSPGGPLLPVGGARAAYQVGVLTGMAAPPCEARRGGDPQFMQAHSPFTIPVGTLAGVSSAAELACHADHFTGVVDQPVRVWQEFRVEQIYRAAALHVLRSGARWLSLLSIGRMVRCSLKLRPKSVLDTSPLLDLLARDHAHVLPRAGAGAARCAEYAWQHLGCAGQSPAFRGRLHESIDRSRLRRYAGARRRSASLSA